MDASYGPRLAGRSVVQRRTSEDVTIARSPGFRCGHNCEVVQNSPTNSISPHRVCLAETARSQSSSPASPSRNWTWIQCGWSCDGDFRDLTSASSSRRGSGLRGRAVRLAFVAARLQEQLQRIRKVIVQPHFALQFVGRRFVGGGQAGGGGFKAPDMHG